MSTSLSNTQHVQLPEIESPTFLDFPSHFTTNPYAGQASCRTSRTRVDMDILAEETEAPTSPTPNIQPLTEPVASQPPAPAAVVEPAIPRNPQVSLTFLLVSGRRRTMSFEPDATVGRVKEFAWAGWPSDWQDERPPTPAHLRILHLGKVLQDGDDLTKLNFPVHTPTDDIAGSAAAHATIVHLSIRPFAPQEEEDLKKGRRKRGRSGTDGGSEGGVGPNIDAEGTAGCCSCTIC